MSLVFSSKYRARRAHVPGRRITFSRRSRVFERDYATCVCCGFFPHTERDSGLLEIDHIVPFARGGTNAIDNLQVLCERCNNMKGTLGAEAFEDRFWGKIGAIHATEWRLHGKPITELSNQGWR